MNNPFYTSSIGKKQIVAVTGLMLIIFVLGHLAGNLLMILGPEVFNAYAHKMASLRPGLLIVEFGLLLVFIIHMVTTALIVLENIRARGQKYAVQKSKAKRSWATRLMPYSGTAILAFVIWHLFDFTFIDHHGVRSIMADGQSYGLYGVVYNSFTNPVHSALYIMAMVAIGMHLSHGIQSFAQTFGFNHPKYTPLIQKISNFTGSLIAVGFSSIPVYVMFDSFKF